MLACRSAQAMHLQDNFKVGTPSNAVTKDSLLQACKLLAASARPAYGHTAWHVRHGSVTLCSRLRCLELDRCLPCAQVHNSCFFAGAAALPETDALVANPPYIAAPDDDLLMPALYGGPDGANLTRVRQSD